MGTWSFCGPGANFLPHHTCATEGAGPIQDRTCNSPGNTDQGIMAARKVLMKAIREVQAGRPPRPTRDTLVAGSDALLPASVDWHHYWEDVSLGTQLTTLPV